MQIDPDTLRQAVDRGVLTEPEARALWAHLEAEQAQAGGLASTGAPLAWLQRRSFAVAGALGLAAVAGHLADDLLDAKALSFALTAIALGVIGLGLLYHLRRERLEARLAALVPARLRRLLPPGLRANPNA